MVSIYQRADGTWVAERAGEVEEVQDGADILIDGTTWRLHIPNMASETMENVEFTPGADEAQPAFCREHDEERGQTERLGDRRYDLKSRSHHCHPRLLLTLARVRVSDAEGRASGDRPAGCTKDDLANMLRLDDNAIYLAVFRARKQLEKAGVARAAGLIDDAPAPARSDSVGDIHIRVI